MIDGPEPGTRVIKILGGRNGHSLMQPLLSHHLKDQKENEVKDVEVVDEQTKKEKTCLRGRV